MKLVPNWRDAWKWFSLQAMALAIALQSAYLAVPLSMQSRIPETWVDGITIAILILGAIGRLVPQGSKE